MQHKPPAGDGVVTGIGRVAGREVAVFAQDPATLGGSSVRSVLFPSVGALVTDTGGPLAHAAIIAREYGIPGVLATGNATELLCDGQLVTVDGNAGVVALHP